MVRFFAGLFGALAAVFILLSFGTDYWLLASESCLPNPGGSLAPGGLTLEVGVGLLTAASRRASFELQKIVFICYINIEY